ncbi:coiled-coil protein [Hyperthermus butylicus]|uniref:Archaeal coiled-coil protein n=1 Tax=Hyperthermus butylicus (strain DSM 5456 / JCM 9403 / PLM1-5) TaxID=415426 RepID=A2BLS1_HYPBU|nr:hypothetical protein [Hyperthermus butylicus]ABM80932.1 putative archaeal coiled-coil protein [Hyperthermus butylicus DSM 5456]
MSSELMGLSEEELLQRITALREEIKRLKEQRYHLIEEVRSLRQKRRGLIERVRQLRDELRSLREERRQLVEEVRRLRQERRELLAKINQAVVELEKQRRIAAELRPLARKSIAAIRRRIEELEWRQQTQILTPEEEKEIIDEIARLEELLEKTLQSRQVLQELASKRAELIALRLKLRSYGQEIRSRSAAISRIDEKIASIRGEIEKLSPEIDQLTKRIEDLSAEIDKLSQEIADRVTALREALTQLQELRMNREKARALQVLRERKKIVEEKLKRGEPLTIDELKLLYASSPEELEEEGNAGEEEAASASS